MYIIYTNLRYIFACLVLLFSACGTTYGIYHKVAPGETLSNISRTYAVAEDTLVILNRLDGEHLSPGKQIFIPGASRQLYVSGATGEKSTPRSKSALIPKRTATGGERARIVPNAPALPPGTPGLVFRWPVQGHVSSPFGKRDGQTHDGLDIAVDEGTPVKSAADGRVIYEGNGVSGYGNLLIVKHEGLYATVYAHNQENLVEKGEFVEAGQVIAKVGQTGRASGPHLHFEIRFNSKPTNPMPLLPAPGTQISRN